ncbi:hypothetical protein BLNAU_23997 [Blattamonas nauphoetae]|uniref:Transposase n=1 Tax=Blattamonas nauphoetae TaxID=2049346 RepID=A0ABQ9WST4_9EUKA|nr:hypothetical protein BLNAU_23997 [Blattamonas nauphoetae]
MTWAQTRNAAEVVRRWDEPDPPDLGTVHDVVARFLSNGSVLPTKEKPSHVQSEPKMLLKKSEKISRTTLDRMLHDLQFRPYRMQRIHLLYDEDYRDRFEKFTRIKTALVEDETLIDRIWFSDECSFDLTKTVNTHNATYWASTNPHYHVEHLNSGLSVNVFAAISSQGWSFSSYSYRYENTIESNLAESMDQDVRPMDGQRDPRHDTLRLLLVGHLTDKGVRIFPRYHRRTEECNKNGDGTHPTRDVSKCGSILRGQSDSPSRSEWCACGITTEGPDSFHFKNSFFVL